MKLERNQTVLVVIDVQSKLLPVIYDYPALVENIKKVIQGAQILGIPVVLTEQYPEGLGLTVDEIRETLSEYNPIEKMSFSCCGEENFIEKIKQLNRNKILVCGIEAHVCIYQTCMDLLSEGYEVHLLVDAISSRKKEN
ncbi:MAG: hydrolase, partial [Candidatus Marinimicrobia bacterium]|nr:hydrolase [Candidatus Neomarinimicrobiota bacterium]